MSTDDKVLVGPKYYRQVQRQSPAVANDGQVTRRAWDPSGGAGGRGSLGWGSSWGRRSSSSGCRSCRRRVDDGRIKRNRCAARGRTVSGEDQAEQQGAQQKTPIQPIPAACRANIGRPHNISLIELPAAWQIR